MGRVFNITSFKTMMATPEFKATKKQTDIAAEFAEECLDNIEVRGVSLSGQDDNVGVVLTGLFTVSNNQKTAINTPRMKYNVETFGFEEELENIVCDIENEVYEFLFEGKKAQMDLFGADGEPNPLVYVMMQTTKMKMICSRKWQTRRTIQTICNGANIVDRALRI
jgi:hypothetical protein